MGQIRMRNEVVWKLVKNAGRKDGQQVAKVRLFTENAARVEGRVLQGEEGRVKVELGRAKRG